MRAAGLPLLALACCALFALPGCAGAQGAVALSGPEARPPTGLQPTVDANTVANAPVLPATDSTNDPSAPNLEMQITKSMLYAAGLKHGVNPYLVMGLAWHESGWQPSAVSSAGAVGIMQVMPATAAVDGPRLLDRSVNLYDPGDNIDLGTAIIKHNLDAYNNDLAKALCAYYAGGGAVTEWATMRADCRHYVWAVYNAAIMFRDGKGPV
jgi:soluble lytic murein transglycosylase-like protein